MNTLEAHFLDALPINESAPEQLQRYGPIFEQLENLVHVVLNKYKTHAHCEELKDVGREKVYTVLRGIDHKPESLEHLAKYLMKCIDNAIKDRIAYLKRRPALSLDANELLYESIEEPVDDAQGLYELLQELSAHLDDDELFVAEMLIDQCSKAEIERDLVAKGFTKSQAFATVRNTITRLQDYFHDKQTE